MFPEELLIVGGVVVRGDCALIVDVEREPLGVTLGVSVELELVPGREVADLGVLLRGVLPGPPVLGMERGAHRGATKLLGVGTHRDVTLGQRGTTLELPHEKVHAFGEGAAKHGRRGEKKGCG